MLHVRTDAIASDHSRFASIGGAILVHLLLIAFILSGFPKFVPVPRSVHETILLLTPKTKRAEPKPQESSLPRPAAAFSPRHNYTTPATVPETAPETKALSIPFLRCAPENFEKLSPEDREKCAGFGISPPDRNTLVELRSHVREPERHAQELAARRTPANVD